MKSKDILEVIDTTKLTAERLRIIVDKAREYPTSVVWDGPGPSDGRWVYLVAQPPTKRDLAEAHLQEFINIWNNTP